MGHTALVLGDQLSNDNPALEGADRVLVVESRAALTRLRLHRQRRHLVLVAMRRFVRELEEAGREVVHVKLADRIGTSVRDFDDVVAAAPNSLVSRRSLVKAGVRFVPSTQFLTDPDAFATWAGSRKRLVMEDFYRDQRRRFGLLLDDRGAPEGGRWNFDRDNRRPPGAGTLDAPAPWLPIEDELDEEVRRDLDAMGLDDGFGVDGPRLWPASRAEAQIALEDFVAHRLHGFGTWQDAMVDQERWLFHSRLSSSMNLWLLDPLDVCRAVERAWRERPDEIPLNAAEGFIRQVIGWREYVWGMYWLHGDDWRRLNALDAHAPLPEAFWTGETEAHCLASVVHDVRETAYVHHIQRLMVLGNLLLLLRVDPWEAVEWFQLAFIDGAEWVMAANAAGMATFADGGGMMTKPYAGGGNYINRMSQYCGDCRYSPAVKQGPDACPVTALYWDFMATHHKRFADNRRMRMPLRTLDKMAGERVAELRGRAAAFREALG